MLKVFLPRPRATGVKITETGRHTCSVLHQLTLYGATGSHRCIEFTCHTIPFPVLVVVAHRRLISLKLRIRAVVWKRGAHQPGGPPLRTTAAHHFRSSPPGMDAEAGCVGPCETLGPDHHVFPTVRRREAHRSRRIQYWLAEATGSPQYSNATKQHTNGPFCRKS